MLRCPVASLRHPHACVSSLATSRSPRRRGGLALRHTCSWLPSRPCHLPLNGNRRCRAIIAIEGGETGLRRIEADPTASGRSLYNYSCQMSIKEPSYTPSPRTVLTEPYQAPILEFSLRRAIKAGLGRGRGQSPTAPLHTNPPASRASPPPPLHPTCLACTSIASLAHLSPHRSC